MSVKPIPEGYRTITPYLAVEDAAEAIDYYKKAFGAKERARMEAPGDKIGHAELEIGDSVVMLADEFPDMGARGPRAVGGSPVMLHVYVEDVDSVFQQAVSAGAKELRTPEDRFYGDRAAEFEDPFGHRWSIATHVEDVPPEEMSKRAEAAMSGG